VLSADRRALTEIGWERANRLVDLFDAVPGPPRPGLATPKAIYAAGGNDAGKGRRPSCCWRHGSASP
jgi:hypothetical protein